MNLYLLLSKRQQFVANRNVNIIFYSFNFTGRSFCD